MRKRLTQSRCKLIPLAGALALLTTSASAQMPTPSISLQGDPKPRLTPEEQERQQKVDDDYKAATKKIPNQKANNDPWGDVRPPATAPAPKKKQQ